MTRLLVVGIGGFVGAIARYGLSGLVQRHFNGSFPAGTLAVNVVGCLVIGVLMCWVEQRQMFAANTRLLVLTGFLGSLTTFSTFGYETFALVRDREMAFALLNVAGNMCLGLGAVAIGWVAAKAICT